VGGEQPPSLRGLAGRSRAGHGLPSASLPDRPPAWGTITVRSRRQGTRFDRPPCPRPAPARRMNPCGAARSWPPASRPAWRHLRRALTARPSSISATSSATGTRTWPSSGARSPRRVPLWNPGWASGLAAPGRRHLPARLSPSGSPSCWAGRPVQGADDRHCLLAALGAARSRAASASAWTARGRPGRLAPLGAAPVAATCSTTSRGAALPWLSFALEGARATAGPGGGAASRARRGGSSSWPTQERCASPGRSSHGTAGLAPRPQPAPQKSDPRPRAGGATAAGLAASPRRVQWLPTAERGPRQRSAVLTRRTPTWSLHPGARRPPGATPRDGSPAVGAARQRSSRPERPRVPLRRPRAPRPRSARLGCARSSRRRPAAGARLPVGPTRRHTPVYALLLACRPRLMRYPQSSSGRRRCAWPVLAAGRTEAWVGRWSAAARRPGRLVAVPCLRVTAERRPRRVVGRGPPDGLGPLPRAGRR